MRWRSHYNAERPHSSFGNLTQEGFARESAVAAAAAVYSQGLIYPLTRKTVILQILLHQGKTPDARESLRRAPDALLGSLLNHGLSP